MAEGGWGDGSPGGDNPVLNKLREKSAELCAVASSATGGYTASPAMEAGTLRCLREQLKQQKSDLQNRINTGEISVDELALEYMTEENLQELIRQLVLELENVKVRYNNKSLLLQRMQVFYRVQNKLMENSTDAELLKRVMDHSLALVHQILKEQKKSQALEKQLIEIRKKRMALKEKSTVLMTDILSLEDELHSQKEPKEKKLKEIFKYVKKETDATFLLQNIFQRLVHASSVNWAADPKLREAVIKAGKDVHSF